MGPVAERLVFGPPAAAQRHAISDFIRFPVRANEWDGAAHPQGTAAISGRIFDDSDFLRQLRLDGLARLFVDGDQTA